MSIPESGEIGLRVEVFGQEGGALELWGVGEGGFVGVGVDVGGGEGVLWC